MQNSCKIIFPVSKQYFSEFFSIILRFASWKKVAIFPTKIEKLLLNKYDKHTCVYMKTESHLS